MQDYQGTVHMKDYQRAYDVVKSAPWEDFKTYVYTMTHEQLLKLDELLKSPIGSQYTSVSIDLRREFIKHELSIRVIRRIQNIEMRTYHFHYRNGNFYKES